MEESEVEELTKNIFTSVDELVEVHPHINGFIEQVSDQKPHIAQGLNIAFRICSCIGGNSGILPLTLLGGCLAGTAMALDPHGDAGAINKQLKDVYNKLSALEDKTDEILIQLQEMNAKGGMKKIQAQFKEMQQKTNLKLWAEHFNSMNLTFAENKVDFEAKNLKALFEYYYTNKCDESLDELKDIYIFVLTTRIMYVKIKVTYYQSYDKFKQEDRENEVLEEIDYCIKDVINIKECMTEVCNYFLPVNSLPDDCPFSTAYIPEVPINGFLSKNKFEYKTSEDYEKLPQSFARAMSTPSKLGDIATSYYTLMSPYQISRIPLSKVDKSKCINGFTCFEWNSKILDHYTPGLYTAKVKFNSFKSDCLEEGLGRIVSSDKVILGTFNKTAEWEGGVVEINNLSQEILYRRIENGKEIEDSVRKYNGYNWVKPSNDQPKEQ